MRTTGSSRETQHVAAAVATLAALAVVGVAVGAVDAGFARGLGRFARVVADALGANKEVAVVAEIVVKSVGKVVDMFYL
jgi:hypothetical protein